MSRNTKLANIFYKLRLIEAYGTGIPRIMDIYKNYEAKPHIEITDNSFAISFPNFNYGKNGEEVKSRTIPKDTERAILDYIKSHGGATRKEIIEGLSLKSTNVYCLMLWLHRVN